MKNLTKNSDYNKKKEEREKKSKNVRKEGRDVMKCSNRLTGKSDSHEVVCEILAIKQHHECYPPVPQIGFHKHSQGNETLHTYIHGQQSETKDQKHLKMTSDRDSEK